MKYPDLLHPFQVSVWDFTGFERISQCNFPCFNLMRRKKKVSFPAGSVISSPYVLQWHDLFGDKVYICISITTFLIQQNIP